MCVNAKELHLVIGQLAFRHGIHGKRPNAAALSGEVSRYQADRSPLRHNLTARRKLINICAVHGERVRLKPDGLNRSEVE
jgi:hypothetical protein